MKHFGLFLPWYMLLFVLELCLFFSFLQGLRFRFGICFGKIFPPKARCYYVTSFPLFLKTQGKWIQALGAVISGIFWLDKR